jgi:hypothetical protein
MNSGDGPESGESPRVVMAGMEEDTRRAVLAEMRQAHEIAAVAGRDAQAMLCDLVCWKAEGRIFSVESKGSEYFPIFGLDPVTGYHPYPVLAEALRTLNASDWVVAAWFVGLSSFLDDQRPKDLLASDPEWVLEAAQDAVSSLNHRNQEFK